MTDQASTMSPALAALVAAVYLFLAKTLAWLIQRERGNAGIVDGIWAWALGSLAAWFAWCGTAPMEVRATLALMGVGWGLRLGTHMWRRNWQGPEDWRYAELRAQWGPQAPSRMFWFFQFQNLFTLALACSAFMPAAWREGSPGPWGLGLAMLIWLVSVAGEALADAQLRVFKANPQHQGQVCTKGLWRHSRHPNYFFECVHWLAYVPLAWGSPLMAWSLLAPMVMLVLILRISGIPLLERRLAVSKVGYAAYIRSTNRLIPGPTRA
jgi:steroid 5-alpha reductase family enzyme